MAIATSSPHAVTDPFDLGPLTPVNLARGARAALLRNSVAVASSPIGAPSRINRHTPSSPLKAVSNTAATEGAQPGNSVDPSSVHSTSLGHYQPVSVIGRANTLARNKVAAYNAKLTVFSAFCQSFEETAKQFTSETEQNFAQLFCNSFLEFWDHALTGTSSVPARPTPTYSSVLANQNSSQQPLTGSSVSAPAATPHPQAHQQPNTLSQEPLPIPAPPKDDLRVFIRLPTDSPVRHNNPYVIRTHIATKAGIT